MPLQAGSVARGSGVRGVSEFTCQNVAASLLSFGWMEIAYVGPVPPLTGGISQHGARLTEALTGLGHVVHVHSWAAQYPKLLYRGPRVDVDVHEPRDARFTLRWWDPLSWKRVGDDARKLDLVVFPWVSPVTALAHRIILGSASPVPAVAIVHNLHPHEQVPGSRAMTRWVFRKAHGALLHSSAEAEVLRAWEPHLKVDVVPHPPNLAFAIGDAPQPPPHKLLFFGHVRPYKGLDIAIEAVRILNEGGMSVELTIAGHFWGRVADWEHRIETAGIRSIVDIRAGYVPDAEVGKLFASHHVVLTPYRSATQSGIVPLARAAGRPVVATEVGGLPDNISEGVDGALAPPGDPHAFALAIERAIGLGMRSPAPAPAGTTWSEVAERVLELGR